MSRMGLQGAPVGSTVRPSAAPMAPAATPAAAPAASASVAPPAGPARSKRAARAYHKDASPALASSGWNDVVARPPPIQAAWQQQAAARVDYRQAQSPQSAPEDNFDSALDQMPGTRNVLSTCNENQSRPPGGANGRRYAQRRSATDYGTRHGPARRCRHGAGHESAQD